MLDKRQGPRNPVPVDGQSSDRGRSGRKNSKNKSKIPNVDDAFDSD